MAGVARPIEQNFKDQFRVKGAPMLYQGPKAFKSEVALTNGEYSCDYSIIENVEFKEGLVFDRTGSLGAGVKLINCTGKYLLITECSTPEYEQNLDFHLSSGLIIDNCQFGRIEINHCMGFTGGVHIRNNSVVNGLDINDSNFNESRLSFDNSTFKQRLRISNVRTNWGIEISTCEIGAPPRIENVKGEAISFLNNTHIENNMFIIGCKSNITFNESVFDDDVNIQNCEINQFTSYGGHFKKGIKLEMKSKTVEGIDGFIKKIFLQNTATDEGFIFEGKRSKVEALEVSCTNLLSGSFSFKEFNFAVNKIVGLNKNANLSFNSCSFENIELDNFHNQSALTFSNCRASSGNSIFGVKNSDLGDTLFVDFDFRGFYDLSISDSIVSESRFSGGHIFTSDQLYRRSKSQPRSTKNLSSMERYFRRKREVFKQFRNAADAQGDNILSTEFKAQELDNYWRELSCSKKWWNRDRLVLLFSSTNDMGMNWAKPTKWLIGITIFFYLPIMICASDKIDFIPIKYFSLIDWETTFLVYWDNLYLILRLLNPTRIISRVIQDPDSNWIYLWDTLHKIILAFLTFQIVSAFRKYIK